MPHDVFISFANADKAAAETLCASLEAGGIRCWIAPRNALAGLSSGAQTVQAIAQSRIELLVLSGNANGSRTVLSEVKLAANRGQVILPRSNRRRADVQGSRVLPPGSRVVRDRARAS